MDSDDDYVEETAPVGKGRGVAGRTRRRRDDDDDDDAHMLSDDDDEYEDEEDGPSKKSSKKTKKKRGPMDPLKGANGGYIWEEELARSWDVVQENEDGSLNGLVKGLVDAQKRKKIVRDVRPFQRGIIRTLVVAIDGSQAMDEKDLRPNRYGLTVTYLVEFINEFFDQNPISQLGIVAMRNGVATVVSDVSGNPVDHVSNLKAFQRKNEPKGDPSLQNVLEMLRGMLMHALQHLTKEILVVFGTLFSSDPGDIFKTIGYLVKEKIRVRIIGLSAQVNICSKIVSKTNYGDASNYGVILNEQHFKELLQDCITPLAVVKKLEKNEQSRLVNIIKMGFPKRLTEEEPTFCSCHSNLTYGGYLCPFCSAKICSLPSICPSCNLMLISSAHLARSYHHLFPLNNYKQVEGDLKAGSCYGCQQALGQEVQRYQCEDCRQEFCIDCNVFVHETLHNCPGCECDTAVVQ